MNVTSMQYLNNVHTIIYAITMKKNFLGQILNHKARRDEAFNILSIRLSFVKCLKSYTKSAMSLNEEFHKHGI